MMPITHNTPHYIDVQNQSDAMDIAEKDFNDWANTTLQTLKCAPAELSLCIVDASTIQTLNQTYRQQDKPTNVLAFPSELPDYVALEHRFLGDVILCAEVIYREAQEFNKPLDAHWAHIVVHGILHLLGFDHINDEDAKRMQAQEIIILDILGFASPYLHEDTYIE